MQTREADRQKRGEKRSEARRKRGSGDAATRQRLLDAGLQRFADKGFAGVTVRDLCRAADANVASVNYHFGDKLGLYREVMERALEGAREDVTISAPAGAGPEARIRHYVHTLMPRLASPSEDALSVQKLMRHEMNDPTPLAQWIADEVILPRIRFLNEAVAELLDTDPDDPRVRRCVVSVQAQCLFYQPNNFRKVAMPGWREMTAAEIAAAADHIVAFTLAGIERIANG
jgi:AcrR family transcriptional regulator